MKTRWLIYILLGVFLSSCYKEENIEGEEDETHMINFLR